MPTGNLVIQLTDLSGKPVRGRVRIDLKPFQGHHGFIRTGANLYSNVCCWLLSADDARQSCDQEGDEDGEGGTSHRETRPSESGDPSRSCGIPAACFVVSVAVAREDERAPAIFKRHDVVGLRRDTLDLHAG
jgi:hypothetical protein